MERMERIWKGKGTKTKTTRTYGARRLGRIPMRRKAHPLLGFPLPRRSRRSEGGAGIRRQGREGGQIGRRARQAELRLPFFTELTYIRIRKLSPHPHHTRSRPRSRTATPTRSWGMNRQRALPVVSPRSPPYPRPPRPPPRTSSTPASPSPSTIPAHDIHRRNAKEGRVSRLRTPTAQLIPPACARAGGHADADTVLAPRREGAVG
ncbi:hypothetical protein B0H14DRAFT_1055629 [Mycena olivaceomarginata]|nr:hypothetical protein B0H14DRAFT_1055629 [Mycena olivaceomarginata]